MLMMATATPDISFAKEKTYLEPTYIKEMNVQITHNNVNSSPILANNQKFTISGKYSLVEKNNLVLDEGEYEVKINNDKIHLYHKGSLIYSDSKKLTVFPIVYGLDSTLKLGGKEYLGTFTFDKSKNSVVNSLPLENYLYGVVPYEIGANTPIEAQKAQAISARNHATVRINQLINDSTQYQVYKGFDKKNETSNSAVYLTRGQVITYGGKIVDVYYSASNGGNTLSIWNSWGQNGSQKEYLTYKEDPYDNTHKWNFSIAKEQIDLTNLDLNDANSWWNNTEEIGAETTEIKGLKEFIKGMNTNIAKKEFKIANIKELSFTETKGNTKIDDSTKLTGKISVEVLILNEQKEVVKETFTYESRTYDFYLKKVFGSVGNQPLLKSANVYSVNLVDGVYEVSGGGYGHGIGMSQNGAIQRANNKQTYDEILKFYYSGVTITPPEETQVFINHNDLNDEKPGNTEETTDPGQPTDPVKPETPTKPSEPEKPKDPEPVTPEKPETEVKDVYYVVKKGDNLSKISREYGVTVNEIVKLNNIKKPSLINIGQKLLIKKGTIKDTVVTPPVTETKPTEPSKPTETTKPVDKNESNKDVLYIVKKGDTLSQIAKKNNVTLQSIIDLNKIKNPSLIKIGQEIKIPGKTVKEVTHIIKKGEWLTQIAKQYNVSLQKIIEKNKIKNPSIISVGQKIIIPM